MFLLKERNEFMIGFFKMRSNGNAENSRLYAFRTNAQNVIVRFQYGIEIANLRTFNPKTKEFEIRGI